MQALSRSHYARLEQLTFAYQQRYKADFKHAAQRNPCLGVDALCFRMLGANELLGIWITPLSLSLACVSIEAEQTKNMPQENAMRIISLPSGHYRFIAERLCDDFLWRCELLDDLSDLEGASEAARLAQRAIERVMAVGGETR